MPALVFQLKVCPLAQVWQYGPVLLVLPTVQIQLRVCLESGAGGSGLAVNSIETREVFEDVTADRETGRD